MTTPELKPCPFCGHKNIKIISFSYEGVKDHKCYYSQCLACDARLREKTSKEAAVKYWNTRAPQPQSGDRANCGMIVMTQEGFDKLVEMLDREPQHKPRLSALLREDSVFDKQPTEAVQGALFVLSTHIAPDDSLGQKCLETIRAALQPYVRGG